MNTNRFQLWDLSGSKEALRLEDRDATPGWDFRPRTSFSRWVTSNGSIDVIDTATGQSRYRLPATTLKRVWVALHPSEPVVAGVSYYSHSLEIRALTTGALIFPPYTLPWRGSSQCAWSPDGRLLAVSDGDSGRINLYAYDPAATGLRLIHALKGLGTGGTSIQFNQAGDRLAARGWTTSVQLFDVQSGRLLFATPPTPSATKGNVPLRFDRTGRRLAAARVGDQEDRVGLWSVADGREYKAVGGAPPYLLKAPRPGLHPDGRLAALGLADGFAVYDLQTGKELGIREGRPRRRCGVLRRQGESTPQRVSRSLAVAGAQPQPGVAVGPSVRPNAYRSIQAIATSRPAATAG